MPFPEELGFENKVFKIIIVVIIVVMMIMIRISDNNNYNNNNFFFYDNNNLFKNIKPTPFTRTNTNKKM